MVPRHRYGYLRHRSGEMSPRIMSPRIMSPRIMSPRRRELMHHRSRDYHRGVVAEYGHGHRGRDYGIRDYLHLLRSNGMGYRSC